MSLFAASEMTDPTVWCVVCVVALVFAAVRVMYLRTLAGALRDCSPQNRTMPPWAVWLNLIPLFRLVFQFVTVDAVASSLKAEFASRRGRVDGDLGRSVGSLEAVLALIPPLALLYWSFSESGRNHHGQIDAYRRLLTDFGPAVATGRQRLKW